VRFKEITYKSEDGRLAVTIAADGEDDQPDEMLRTAVSFVRSREHPEILDLGALNYRRRSSIPVTVNSMDEEMKEQLAQAREQSEGKVLLRALAMTARVKGVEFEVGAQFAIQQCSPWYPVIRKAKRDADGRIPVYIEGISEPFLQVQWKKLPGGDIHLGHLFLIEIKSINPKVEALVRQASQKRVEAGQKQAPDPAPQPKPGEVIKFDPDGDRAIPVVQGGQADVDN